ncbi:hypothetical protein ANO11243_091230 [Dothideomycetidae sp. 11243]|nr:hypothetical protein ANO11243_091230 [fungal sp. No.11243]
MLEIGICLVAVNLPSLWLLFTTSILPEHALRTVRSIFSRSSLRSSKSERSGSDHNLKKDVEKMEQCNTKLPAMQIIGIINLTLVLLTAWVNAMPARIPIMPSEFTFPNSPLKPSELIKRSGDVAIKASPKPEEAIVAPDSVSVVAF